MDATASPSLAKAPRLAGTASAIVFAIATATILTALAYEHVGGYAACPLCLQERYAYYFAVPASALALYLARGESPGIARILLALIAAAFIANAVAGVYHAGVEWAWWEGPDTCAGGFDLKWDEGGVAETPVIRCDEASWRFLGLSFAGWNALISAALAAIAAYGAAKRY
jgi:disulfide bond formation protein DsbB